MSQRDREFRVDNHSYKSIYDYKCVKNTRVCEVETFSKLELLVRVAEVTWLGLLFQHIFVKFRRARTKKSKSESKVSGGQFGGRKGSERGRGGGLRSNQPQNKAVKKKTI